MALRAATETIVGLATYWQNAAEEPKMKWDRWIELFGVALMAKFSISTEELTRDVTHMARRQPMMGGLDENTAERKAVSVLVLAMGEAARKTLMDRKPQLDFKTIGLKDLIEGRR